MGIFSNMVSIVASSFMSSMASMSSGHRHRSHYGSHYYQRRSVSVGSILSHLISRSSSISHPRRRRKRFSNLC